MKPTTKIRLKALFLLATFSMNSAVGFACSVGIDMGFNADHHEHGGKEQHKHPDNGYKDGHLRGHHGHHGKKDHKHSHSHSKTFNPHNHQTRNTVSFNTPEDDNCCKDFVIGFQNMDKAPVKGNNTLQQPHIVLSPFIIPVILGLNNTKGFTEHFRTPPKEIDLPPPDIVILIQSFLI